MQPSTKVILFDKPELIDYERALPSSMASPFEESLRNLNEVAQGCRVDLQSVFVNTQAEAEVFSAELLRSAQAVIDGIKAKLPPPVRVIRRRRRRSRNSRKKLHPKTKRSFKKVQSRRTAVRGREALLPTESHQVELNSVSNSVKESTADDQAEETGGLLQGTDADIHPSNVLTVENVTLQDLTCPHPAQPVVKFARTIQADQPVEEIVRTSHAAKGSDKNARLVIRTIPSIDGSPQSQPARTSESTQIKDRASVQLKNSESGNTPEQISKALQSSQRHDQKNMEKANQAESRDQPEQNRRSSATTSSFYSAIDELDDAVLKNSKSEGKTPLLLSATIEQKTITKETQKNKEVLSTQIQPSTPTKTSEDIQRTCDLPHDVSVPPAESASAKSAVEEVFKLRELSPPQRTEKLNNEHKLRGNQASEGDSAAEELQNTVSCARSSSERDSILVSRDDDKHCGAMSRTASQTNPTSLRGLEEDSSTDQLQQPEGKPIDERNRRHSRTHRKSPSDGKREANTNPDMTDMDKFCEPDSQALRKRPRLTNPKDGACPENIVSLKVDSEDVNTFGSAHSQEPVERKLKVQRSPHFKDSQRIQTHRSQIEEEESDEAQDRVQVQDAVLDDNEVLSSNIQSFTDRKNITPESIQARPSIEATLVGPKPNSLPNYAEIKSTGDSVLGSSVNTIAKPETSPKFPVPKETRTASKRIVVDRDGKVDQESLGILSKIAANAVNTTLEREKPRREPPPEQSQTPRTTKLFNPNSNIYALPRPSASSSVQRYTASSRSSMLSHTPGAQLPFKPVSNETSFGEKLASLNERFELLKKSQPDESRPGNYRSDEELNITTGLRTAEDHRNEMASVQRRVLTFAETDERPLAQHGMKTEPVREKQRTRFNAKPKSALRAKVEEIMTGKSNNLVSTPTASSAATIPSFSHSVLPTYGKSKSLLGSLKPETLDEPYSTGQPASQLEPEKDFANGIGDGPGNISVPAEQQTANNLPALRIPAARHSSHTTRESTSEDKHQEQSVLPTANEKVVDRGVSTETREFEEAESQDKKAPLGNLMTSLTSFIPGACSFLGSRPVRDRSEEESEAEATAKRQKLDMERREAELQARREAQRLLKQKETEEKQRRAERRRMLLARAEKEKEEERRRKEERRLKKKLEEEELRKKRKQEEDRKREERRRQVLEKRAQNQAKQKRTKKGLEAGGVRKIVKDGSSKVASTQMGGVEQGHGEEVVDLSVGGEKGTGGPLQTPVRKKVDSNTGPSTYMMTPAQETVLEHSDEEEERRKHKQIPRWAQGRKLSTAARAQPDPDEVFVNVPTCDLREVFGNARRFRARTSSANWTKDRVTSQEMMRFRKEQAAFNDEKG